MSLSSTKINLAKKILESNYVVPSYVEKPCKEMIRNLLMVDPNHRFKLQDIKNHSWYNQINCKEPNFYNQWTTDFNSVKFQAQVMVKGVFFNSRHLFKAI
jgi:serine/threonine protein kinase